MPLSDSSSYPKSIIRYALYPVTMLMVLWGHLLLRESNSAFFIQVYAPMIFGAVVITLMEFQLRFKTSWQPELQDWGKDALFMTLVQTVQPKLLGLLFVYLASQSFMSGLQVWPADWHPIIQVVMVFLLADFLRYWLHRWSHEVPWLWSFHKIHHLPNKLYWYNVGRFHPVDKGLQLLLDTLPFVILGVPGEIIAIYFVLYGVNGFFQHSNLDIKLGVLNSFIAGPELHRWHHSKDLKEGHLNYGNNLIIWDRLFGTFYTNDNTDDLKVGVPGQIELQLKQVPFYLVNLLINLGMKLKMILSRRLWHKLERDARDPEGFQQKVLNQIIETNLDTEFARVHKLKKDMTIAEFQQQVPLSDYDSCEESILEQMHSGRAMLTTAKPFMYAQTSGTTGKSKYIPVIHQELANQQSAQDIYAHHLYQADKSLFSGKILSIVSPAVEGYTATGLPYGSASGVMYQNMPRLAAMKCVVPYDIFSVEDYHTKYLLILLFAVMERNISVIGTANPSTILKLQSYLDQFGEELAKVYADGDLDHLPCSPHYIPRSLMYKKFKDPIRSAQLKELLAIKGKIDFEDIWPELRGMITWTAGSCGVPIGQLRKRLSDKVRNYEAGYLASEVKGTIPLNQGNAVGVPTFNQNFFEFAEKNEWESDNKNLITLSQVEAGKEYYIFFTTVSGLYRYNINDIVRVDGFLGKIPLIRFVQKGKGVTNITGEKLYEGQVISVIKQYDPRFYMMVADPQTYQYTLYMNLGQTDGIDAEALQADLDVQLGQINIEYHSKRQSQRLKPLNLKLVNDHTAEDFKKYFLARGQREGQFKYLTLQYAADMDFPLNQYVQ